MQIGPAMYTVDSLDRIEDLAGVPPADPGAPMPLLVADEHGVVVAFVVSAAAAAAAEAVTDGEEESEAMAVVRFVGARIHAFGAPSCPARARARRLLPRS
jgi:hypothetical protein